MLAASFLRHGTGVGLFVFYILDGDTCRASDFRYIFLKMLVCFRKPHQSGMPIWSFF
jgi:hypothetical protein